MLTHKKCLTSFVKNKGAPLCPPKGGLRLVAIHSPLGSMEGASFLWPKATFFTVRYFVFVIVFGIYEWQFISIAMRYADELTLIDARDALQMQT